MNSSRLLPLAFSSLLLLTAATIGFAADPPVDAYPKLDRWQGDMKRFAAADEKDPPKPGGVLFLGSSSIRMWDLEKSFPGKDYLNRGFGGSQISDSIAYIEELVFRYEPKAIVFYAGDNDIAAGESAESVAADYRRFSELVAERLPETSIHYIAIKPSRKRWALYDEIKKANDAIAEYSEATPHRSYVDIAAPMLAEEGPPPADLFADDGLHLSPKGYAMWTERVQESLGEKRSSSEPVDR